MPVQLYHDTGGFAVMLRRRQLSLLLRAAVSLLVLAYIADKLEWRVLAELLGKVDYHWVVTAFIVFGLAWLAAAVRWHCLLRVQAINLPLRSVLGFTMVGAFFNTFLLGATGGDVARLWYVLGRCPERKTAAALSVIVDRLLGLLVLLMLTLFFILLRLDIVFEQSQLRALLVPMGVILMMLLAGALLLLFMPLGSLPQWLQRWWQKLPYHHLGQLALQAFRQHLQVWPPVAVAALCSLLVQLMVFWSAFLLGRATGMQTGFFDMAIIVSIVTCIISLPVSIGGHGVREAAFLLMFPLLLGSTAAVPGKEAIMIFSLLYLLLNLGWSLLGGIVYLLFDPLSVIRYKTAALGFTDIDQHE